MFDSAATQRQLVDGHGGHGQERKRERAHVASDFKCGFEDGGNRSGKACGLEPGHIGADEDREQGRPQRKEYSSQTRSSHIPS